MKITQDHLYHGAVLNQIAKHEQFTAINALQVKGKTSRSAFKVNRDIAVYLKYASKPTGRFKEYFFTFNKYHLSDLRNINKVGNKLHLALVCVQAHEVCCFYYEEFVKKISERKSEFGRSEEQYTILVTLERNASFRVNVNAPGKKKLYLGKPLIVKRNACPNCLFR